MRSLDYYIIAGLRDKVELLEAKEKKLTRIKSMIGCWKKHEGYTDIKLIRDIVYLLGEEI